MKIRNRLHIAIALSMLLSGCVSTGQIKLVAMPKPITPQDGKSKLISISKIIIDLPRATDIGSIQTGWLCAAAQELYWANIKGGTISLEEMEGILKTELERHNYQVDYSNDLFKDEAPSKAEYVLAGKVTEVSANICYPWAGFGNYGTSGGGGYMKVTWHIYSKKQKKVVLRIVSEGNSDISSRPLGDVEVFYSAFAMAISNMLSDNRFHDLVTLWKKLGAPEVRTSSHNDIKVDSSEVSYAGLGNFEVGEYDFSRGTCDMSFNEIIVINSSGHKKATLAKLENEFQQAQDAETKKLLKKEFADLKDKEMQTNVFYFYDKNVPDSFFLGKVNEDGSMTLNLSNNRPPLQCEGKFTKETELIHSQFICRRLEGGNRVCSFYLNRRLK